MVNAPAGEIRRVGETHRLFDIFACGLRLAPLTVRRLDKEMRLMDRRDISAQKCRGSLPTEAGAPETGILSQCDLLTPQAEHLKPGT